MFSKFSGFQVTKMYETVMKEKDGLVAKLVTVEEETKKLKEQLASEREATATAAKVCLGNLGRIQVCCSHQYISLLQESEKLQAQLKKQRTELAKAQASSEKHVSALPPIGTPKFIVSSDPLEAELSPLLSLPFHPCRRLVLENRVGSWAD